ncbi:MAG: hypothetical protein GY869_26415, partial [Planctomycetes bacterium]|nr:hypothetical protein [Planctomycetota bacterium]
MRTLALIVSFFCLVPSILQAQPHEKLTLEDIFDSRQFAGDSLWQAKWIPDRGAFTFMKHDKASGVNSIYQHDVLTGDESLLLDGHSLFFPESDSLLPITGYSWSENGGKILLKTNKVEIWRHSLKCAVYVYDFHRQTVIPVFEGEERIANVRVSPDDHHVGYVYKNNIYTRNLATGKIVELGEAVGI